MEVKGKPQNAPDETDLSFTELILRSLFAMQSWSDLGTELVFSWSKEVSCTLCRVNMSLRITGHVCLSPFALVQQMKPQNNTPLDLYMSNPQLARITHWKETGSQFEGRANNSALLSRPW